jgi:hypothetical protein
MQNLNIKVGIKNSTFDCCNPEHVFLNFYTVADGKFIMYHLRIRTPQHIYSYTQGLIRPIKKTYRSEEVFSSSPSIFLSQQSYTGGTS